MTPNIRSNLKKYRIDKGLTQEALAEILGVTRQTINAIEQSKYQPSLYLAYQCAKLFKVSIEDIFNFNV
jgi:putative transcriptional regulator